jgi:hypothetical protein
MGRGQPLPLAATIAVACTSSSFDMRLAHYCRPKITTMQSRHPCFLNAFVETSQTYGLINRSLQLLHVTSSSPTANSRPTMGVVFAFLPVWHFHEHRAASLV